MKKSCGGEVRQTDATWARVSVWFRVGDAAIVESSMGLTLLTGHVDDMCHLYDVMDADSFRRVSDAAFLHMRSCCDRLKRGHPIEARVVGHVIMKNAKAAVDVHHAAFCTIEMVPERTLAEGTTVCLALFTIKLEPVVSFHSSTGARKIRGPRSVGALPPLLEEGHAAFAAEVESDASSIPTMRRAANDETYPRSVQSE